VIFYFQVNAKTETLLTLTAFVILLLTIALLSVTLAQAWRNERFLDATINKYTTTWTNK
jgi:hypothetical protein